jgi:large subunit ribosomal protein L21
MYAIVTSGGKQYKVLEGDVFRIEKMDVPVGDTVELADVAMLVTDDGIVAAPEALSGAKVVCRVIGQGKSKKVHVYKRKRKKNYARTAGHRQLYTELRVAQIIG